MPIIILHDQRKAGYLFPLFIHDLALIENI